MKLKEEVVNVFKYVEKEIYYHINTKNKFNVGDVIEYVIEIKDTQKKAFLKDVMI